MQQELQVTMLLAQCARLMAFSAKRERKLKNAAVLHHKHPQGLISQSGRLRRAAAGGQWSHCPACLRQAPNIISRPYLSQILPAAQRPASGTIVTACQWACWNPRSCLRPRANKTGPVEFHPGNCARTLCLHSSSSHEFSPDQPLTCRCLPEGSPGRAPWVLNNTWGPPSVRPGTVSHILAR